MGNDDSAKKENNDNERKRKSYDEDSSSSDDENEEEPPPGLEIKKDKPKEEDENQEETSKETNGTKEAAGDDEDEEATTTNNKDALKRKDECKAALEKRIDVFTRFLEEKRFNDIAIDGDQSDPMVKLLDSVVIFLEGGTDFDLEILDQELSEKAEEKMKMEEINKDNKELGEKSIGGEEVKK